MGDPGYVPAESSHPCGDEGDTSSYNIQPHWHSNLGALRVICVGAGAAGLCVAYKMKKNFAKYELICYEKNPSVAGTWYENRYPGAACDVPAHAYTYSFEPNPDWSTFYAYAPEIKQYFEKFAEKYDLMRFVKLNTKVLDATWDEENGIYEVQVESNGQKIRDWCHVLINGTGFLNSWKWPKIDGLQDFAGTLLHSANYDTSCLLDGKTVAVLGTGSSAIQILPQAQKQAKHVVSFMRSVTWISPPVGQSLLDTEKAKATVNGDDKQISQEQKAQAQYWYTDEEKARFRNEPEYHLRYRQDLESSVNSLFDMFIADSDTSKWAENFMKAEMERRIGPGHDELKTRLIPSWPPGCRRITPGDGYLEALVKPNVTTIHKEISKIVPDGLIDEDGHLHKVDIIICATGFNLAFAPPFEVKGMGGVTMAQEFDPEPQVYLAITVPKFPNYFAVNGVRGNWAAGTALPSIEQCIEYILKCANRIQEDDIRALEVKQEPVDQLYAHIDEWHKGSIWNKPCKSWYKNNIIGGKLWIWGGSALHYMKTIKDVRWEHYDIRYRSSNMWAFLGNGRVKAEVTKDLTKLAPYMRNSDVPWDIES